MRQIHNYRTDAERLRHAARQAPLERRDHLLQLAELYDSLANADEALAQTPWPPRSAHGEPITAAELLSIPITIEPLDH